MVAYSITIIIYLVVGLFLVACDSSEVPTNHTQNTTTSIVNNNCITKDTYLKVSGKSLSPVVAEGDELRTLFGFYDCNIIQVGDFVLYRFGEKISYVKFVVGKYNDKFGLIKNQNNKYNITINSKILTNLNDIPYELDEYKTRMLKLEIQQTGGIIPRGKFFVMGNLVKGSHDSTHYGLVNRSEILAKVMVDNK